MSEINKLQSGCGFVQYQTPISAGGTTFSSNFEKGGSEKKKECLGGLKKSLLQIFGWGACYVFCQKRLRKMNYGFEG